VTFVVSGVVVTSVVTGVVDWIPNAAMCIRKPEPEPRFWIFQTRKPGFGRTAPDLETLTVTKQKPAVDQCGILLRTGCNVLPV